jgi:hypothetical protein
MQRLRDDITAANKRPQVIASAWVKLSVHDL